MVDPLGQADFMKANIRPLRGTRGGRASNSLFPDQERVQFLHSPSTLKLVVKAAKELCQVDNKGRFVRGCLLQVKQQFPELRL